MTVWPGPRPDPAFEQGEDPDTHLLPNLERLRALDRDQRRRLVELVADWDGPLVEAFRARVRELER